MAALDFYLYFAHTTKVAVFALFLPIIHLLSLPMAFKYTFNLIHSLIIDEIAACFYLTIHQLSFYFSYRAGGFKIKRMIGNTEGSLLYNRIV